MTLLIALIVVLFPIGILIRKVLPNLCAICFATSTAWIIGLLYLLIYGENVSEVDIISLAILIGGSVVGSMYYFFSKLSREKQLFKLPFLVTLFTLVYIILTREFEMLLVIEVGVLWSIFFLLYLVRNNSKLKESVDRIIKCCKNW